MCLNERVAGMEKGMVRVEFDGKDVPQGAPYADYTKEQW